MPARRIEFTVSEETWQRIEVTRGDVPRAAWIKRAINDALPSETEEEARAAKTVRNRKAPTFNRVTSLKR